MRTEEVTVDSAKGLLKHIDQLDKCGISCFKIEVLEVRDRGFSDDEPQFERVYKLWLSEEESL